jgi:hypothetical protein
MRFDAEEMMSPQCGDTDPAVVFRLLVNNQGDVKKTEQMLNRDSGVLGRSGISADIRDVLAAANGSFQPVFHQGRGWSCPGAFRVRSSSLTTISV